MLKRLFGFDRERKYIKTEIFAGLTSFLTMSYILAVNPSIFSALDGMPKGAVFTTTALVAIVGTLIMAFIAKKPFRTLRLLMRILKRLRPRRVKVR